MPSRVLRTILSILAILTVAGSSWGLAQIFGIGPFSGGTLTVVYRLTDVDNDPNPGVLTLKVSPENGKFKVTETYEKLAEQDEIQVFVFSHGFTHARKGYLDLTPISALDTREVLPDKEILLPEGAKLVTTEEVIIGGVKAVQGIYTHPNYEDQRAIIAIGDVESRKILTYPPLLRIEKQEGEIWTLVALTQLESVSMVP